MIRCILMLLVLSSMCLWAAPVDDHGRLSVANGVIVDKNGNPPQLRGMSLFWSQWSSGFYNQNVINTLASTGSTGWGATLVRAAIADYDIQTAKNVIDWAIAAGIYVLVDNHSHSAHNELSTAKNFFSEISKYVKDKGNPVNVIYELYNEPVDCTWEQIKNYAEAVIPVIRANDPNNLILIGTPNYSRGTEAARANPITMDNNIGYVLHFYASESGHGSLRTNLLKAHCNAFPVFISEWGNSDASGDGTLVQSMMDTWVSYMETLKLSWANWSLFNKNETSAALKTSAGTGGYWSDDQLSQSGTYVRNIMKKRNAGASLSSVGLTEATIDCSVLDGAQIDEFDHTGNSPFRLSFQAENYSDSSNVQTIIDSSSSAEVYRYILNTTSSDTWTSYVMTSVPEAGYFRFRIRYGTASNGIILKYNVGDAPIQEISLPSTGSLLTFESVFNSVYIPEVSSDSTIVVKLSLEGSSPGLASLDAFYIAYADSADSANFNIPSSISKYPDFINSSSFYYDVSSNHFILPSSNYHRMDVFSLNGQKKLQQNVHGLSSVSAEDLPPGLYFIRLSGSSGTIHIKASIMH